MPHLHDGALPERHALHWQFGAQVSTGHHGTIHSIQNAVQALHRICGLDLGQHLHPSSTQCRTQHRNTQSMISHPSTECSLVIQSPFTITPEIGHPSGK